MPVKLPFLFRLYKSGSDKVNCTIADDDDDVPAVPPSTPPPPPDSAASSISQSQL
jgi:hypothetical protein